MSERRTGDWSARVEVARWEFERFVKPKQLLISFAMMLVLGGIGYWVSKMAERSARRIYRVAVVGGEALGLTARDTVGSLDLVPAAAAGLDSLRKAVADRAIAGVAVLRGADTAELIVRRDPVWRGALDAHLTALRQRRELERAGLAPERLAAILAPVAVRTTYHGGGDTRGARVAALVATGLVMYGVFMAMAFMMVSVTAEKQLRVTEQVVSAIAPETWIDGKILGLGAVSVVNVLIFAFGGVLWLAGRSLATGAGISLGPMSAGTLIPITIFAVLGFAFWLAVLVVVAATIDDPNTSTRGPLMFVPLFFSMIGFMVVPNPDSTFARVAGLIPLSSSAVMPVRLTLTDVPLWEQALSALLLVAATMGARWMAGRVFAVAMLMYGKEPSWGEVRRWVREG